VLAVTGRLFGQPFMNWIIGNPHKVVVVQDGARWVNWLLTTVALALVYDWIVGI